MDRAALWRAGGWAVIVAGVLLSVDAGARALASADIVAPGRLWGLPPGVWQLPGMTGTVPALFSVTAIYGLPPWSPCARGCLRLLHSRKRLRPFKQTRSREDRHVEMSGNRSMATTGGLTVTETPEPASWRT